MDAMTTLVRTLFFICLVALSSSYHLEESEQMERLSSLKRVSRQKRVIGGEPISQDDFDSWPYLVRLHGKVPVRWWWGIPLEYNHFYCGASVISKRWVLTAAHCFRQARYPHGTETPKYWHANFGDTIQHTHWWEFWNRDIHADRILIHDDYEEGNVWASDLALVRMECDVDERPIELPPYGFGSDWPSDGTACVMKGWGCTSNGGPLSDNAHAVMLPKFPDTNCTWIYPATMDKRLCAGAKYGDTGICSGDSGGPLVCPVTVDGQTRMVEAGIASFTSANNPGSYPGVFTRLTEYDHLHWIRTEAGLN